MGKWYSCDKVFITSLEKKKNPFLVFHVPVAVSVVCNLILSSHSTEDIGKVHIIPTVEETEAQRDKKCVQGHIAPVCLTPHACYFHHILMIPKDSWRPSLLNSPPAPQFYNSYSNKYNLLSNRHVPGNVQNI